MAPNVLIIFLNVYCLPLSFTDICSHGVKSRMRLITSKMQAMIVFGVSLRLFCFIAIPSFYLFIFLIFRMDLRVQNSDRKSKELSRSFHTIIKK